VSSRNLVKASLEFQCPQRVPRDLWLLPWASDHYANELKQIKLRFPSDIATAPAIYKQPPEVQGDPYQIGQYVDEWGCIFTSKQAGVIGEVKEPLIKSWEELDKLRPPTEMLEFDRQAVDEFCRNTDKFVLGGCCPRPFERMQFIRRSDNLYIDLAERKPEFYEMLGKVHQFFLEELELWAKTEVDGLMFMDDWGTQRSLLISPTLWREIFKPLYNEYINLAHRYGKYIFMHSDGHIFDILPDLVEMGLDAVNSQLFCMDIEKIGERLRGKITFWGEIDRQWILSFGSREDVFQAVRRVKESLYADGGVIAQCEFGAGAKPENVYAVFEAWEQVLI